MRAPSTVIEEAGGIPAAVRAQATGTLGLEQLSRQLLWVLLFSKRPALPAFLSGTENTGKPEPTTNLDSPTRG